MALIFLKEIKMIKIRLQKIYKDFKINFLTNKAGNNPKLK